MERKEAEIILLKELHFLISCDDLEQVSSFQ